MSTRSSWIWNDDGGWHVYNELLDGNIHLEVIRDEIEINMVIGHADDAEKIEVGSGFAAIINKSLEALNARLHGEIYVLKDKCHELESENERLRAALEKQK